MNEFALQQQRTVDRIALVGSAIAMLTAAAFVAFDPVQTVSRHSAATTKAAPLSTDAPAADDSPLVRLSLPSPAWTVVSDGESAAYARLEPGQPAEIVVRGLHTDDAHVAYRAAPASYLGQVSLAKGVLVLEEITQPSGGIGRNVTIRTVSVAGGDAKTIDTFTPEASLASSPITDGARIFWVRPSSGARDEIREMNLATGSTRTLLRSSDQLAALALSGETLAYTAFAGDAAKTYLLDLATARTRPVNGFAYSYVQSVGPDGIVVTGAIDAGAPAASWLVKWDGTRTRLGSECFNVTYTARLLAMRCATQIEVRDLATGSSLYRFAGNAGALAVFDDGVVWGEGDELMLYRLPALSNASHARPT